MILPIALAVFITYVYVISEVDSISCREATANRHIDSFLFPPYPPSPTPTVKETIQMEIGKFGILNLYNGDQVVVVLYRASKETLGYCYKIGHDCLPSEHHLHYYYTTLHCNW